MVHGDVNGRSAAIALAREALLYVTERPEEMAGFLGWSGVAPSALRARADDPEFLGFVLDFILLDEARSRDFVEGEGMRPDAARRARAALPGGDAPEWC
jgi:hypothetical protein